MLSALGQSCNEERQHYSHSTRFIIGHLKMVLVMVYTTPCPPNSLVASATFEPPSVIDALETKMSRRCPRLTKGATIASASATVVIISKATQTTQG